MQLGKYCKLHLYDREREREKKNSCISQTILPYLCHAMDFYEKIGEETWRTCNVKDSGGGQIVQQIHGTVIACLVRLPSSSLFHSQWSSQITLDFGLMRPFECGMGE